MKHDFVLILTEDRDGEYNEHDRNDENFREKYPRFAIALLLFFLKHASVQNARFHSECTIVLPA